MERMTFVGDNNFNNKKKIQLYMIKLEKNIYILKMVKERSLSRNILSSY